MSTVPDSADVVVVGAGIVGNCLVGHLAELGWRNIVLIDKGPLPDPGGSTGHASNFIFPVDHSKELALLTLDSQRQYEQMGVQTTCGGIEVARTPERMHELGRRMSSATAWGVESRIADPRRGRRARAVRGPHGHPRRLLHAVGVGRRLAARGHDHARARAGARRADHRDQHRGARRRDRWRPRGGRQDQPWRHRRAGRRRRVRRVEPEDRRDGRCDDPADTGGAPDDRRRPDSRAARDPRRDRLPDRARHGHLLLRAPERR